MPLTYEEIEREALQLSFEDREKLVSALIHSLEPTEGLVDPAVAAQAWQAEAERRWEQYQRGEAEAIPAEQVLARLRRTLGTHGR